MKRPSGEHALVLTAAAAIMLTGCATPAAAKSGIVLDDVYTAVAMTVQAQSTTSVPAATATPTASSVPTATLYEAPTPTAAPSTDGYSYSGGCNNAAYVSDVTIADGTDVAPGETFTKTWELLNTGTCTWSKNYAVFLVSGDSMDGSMTTIQDTVAPRESADISVELTAPDEAGGYVGYWMMEDNDGVSFGEQVYVEITVTEDAATSTPAPTATYSVSPTTTPAATIAVSATPAEEHHRQHPTRTPTATPDPSPTATDGS